MTEKNADVEWLRRELADEAESYDDDSIEIPLGRARRLLAHIDELEARLAEPFPQIPRAPEYRHSIHEIAVQMMAVLLADPSRESGSLSDDACCAYNAAEALVAAGRRR